MLKRPLPGELRRRGGLVLMLGFVVAGCYAVRTAQSQAALPGAQDTLIAVNMKVFVNGVDAIAARGYGSEGWTVLTSDGGQFWVGDDQHKAGCAARIPVAGTAPAAGAAPVPGIAQVAGTAPATDQGLAGLIVLSCELSHAGRTFAKPTLLVRDNESSSIEATDSEDGQVFRVELNASTTPARVAAASAYWEKSHANGAKSFKMERPASGN